MNTGNTHTYKEGVIYSKNPLINHKRGEGKQGRVGNEGEGSDMCHRVETTGVL